MEFNEVLHLIPNLFNEINRINKLYECLNSLLRFYGLNYQNFNIDCNNLNFDNLSHEIEAYFEIPKFRSNGERTFNNYLEVFPELHDILITNDIPRETLNPQSLIKKLPYKEIKNSNSREIHINIQNNNGNTEDVYLLGIGIFNSNTENIYDLKECLENFISNGSLDDLIRFSTFDPIDIINGHANITLNTGCNGFWIYHIVQNNGGILSEPFMLITYRQFLKRIESSYMKKNVFYVMKGMESLFSYYFYSMFHTNNKANKYEIRNIFHFKILFFNENNDNERIIRRNDAPVNDREHRILLNNLVALNPPMEIIIDVLKNQNGYHNVKSRVSVLKDQLLIDKNSLVINLIKNFDFCNIDKSSINILINQRVIYLNSTVNDLLNIYNNLNNLELEGNLRQEIRNILNNIDILNKKSNVKLKTIKLEALCEMILFHIYYKQISNMDDILQKQILIEILLDTFSQSLRNRIFELDYW